MTGAHYEEARGAESRADFVHKIRWLNLIQRAKLLDKDLSGLLREAAELAAILAASAKTARTAFRELIAHSQFPVPGSLFASWARF